MTEWRTKQWPCLQGNYNIVGKTNVKQAVITKDGEDYDRRSMESTQQGDLV